MKPRSRYLTSVGLQERFNDHTITFWRCDHRSEQAFRSVLDLNRQSCPDEERSRVSSIVIRMTDLCMIEEDI